MLWCFQRILSKLCGVATLETFDSDRIYLGRFFRRFLSLVSSIGICVQPSVSSHIHFASAGLHKLLCFISFTFTFF